jgi:uncharacterized membrane protein
MLVWVVVDALKGYFTNKTFENKNNKTGLVLFIAAHLQFLVGLLLYFVSPITQTGLMSMSNVMKNPELRFYVVEHGLAMTIAIALITIGRIVMKKAPTDKAKFGRLAVYNTIALLIILWMIPWSRGLF